MRQMFLSPQYQAENSISNVGHFTQLLPFYHFVRHKYETLQHTQKYQFWLLFCMAEYFLWRKKHRQSNLSQDTKHVTWRRARSRWGVVQMMRRWLKRWDCHSVEIALLRIGSWIWKLKTIGVTEISPYHIMTHVGADVTSLRRAITSAA